MERESVVSSNLASVGYDPATETLEVEFGSGGIFSYAGVTAEEYQTLMGAPSIGSYFARFIKGQKPAERVA